MSRRVFREAEQLALLMGLHARVGKGSSVFNAFHQNPLAAFKPLNIVWEFLDGQGRVSIPQNFVTKVGDTGRSYLHAHALKLEGQRMAVCSACRAAPADQLFFTCDHSKKTFADGCYSCRLCLVSKRAFVYRAT